MKATETTVDELSNKVEEIQSKPGKRWDAVVAALIAGIVGAVVGFVIK